MNQPNTAVQILVFVFYLYVICEYFFSFICELFVLHLYFICELLMLHLCLKMWIICVSSVNQSNTAVQTLAPCSNFQLHKGQTTNNKLKTVILDIILKMNNEFDLSFLFFYPDSVIGWGENGGSCWGEICTAEEKRWLITKFWLAHAPH